MVSRQTLVALTLAAGAAASTGLAQAPASANLEIIASRAHQQSRAARDIPPRQRQGWTCRPLPSAADSDSIQLLSFEVAYANGEHKTIQLRRNHPARPPEPAAPGRARRSHHRGDALEASRPQSRRNHARSSSGARKREAPPNHAAATGGFQVLASQNVDQRGERILFRLGRGEHRYAAIKIRALDDPHHHHARRGPVRERPETDLRRLHARRARPGDTRLRDHRASRARSIASPPGSWRARTRAAPG